MAALRPIQVIPLDTLEKLWAAVGYVPQDYQRDFHLCRHVNKKAIGGGIGAAKTFTASLDWLPEATICGEIRRANNMSSADGYNGRIAIISKTYKSAQVAFLVMLGLLKKIDEVDGPVAMPKDRSWRMVTKSGVEIITVSGQDPMGFSAYPFTHVHGTEAMQLDQDMYDAAIERVSRWPNAAMGSVCLEGTFEKAIGDEWFLDICDRWSVEGNVEGGKFFSFPSWLNTYNYPGGFEGEKVQELFRHYSLKQQEHVFWARMGGKIPQRQGSLWGNFLLPDHFREVTYDPAVPVDFYFDPGLHRYAGIFVQWPDPEHCNIVDELVLTRKSFNDYRDAWLRTPYVHWEEGDASPTNIATVVCDTAAAHRHGGLDSTWTHWTTPIPLGGCGVVPRHRYLHGDTAIEILQTGLIGDFYTITIDPKCVGLMNDLRREQLPPQNSTVTSWRLNRGNDDVRKALCYGLAIVKGVGLGRITALPPTTMKGSGAEDEINYKLLYPKPTRSSRFPTLPMSGSQR